MHGGGGNLAIQRHGVLEDAERFARPSSHQKRLVRQKTFPPHGFRTVGVRRVGRSRCIPREKHVDSETSSTESLDGLTTSVAEWVLETNHDTLNTTGNESLGCGKVSMAVAGLQVEVGDAASGTVPGEPGSEDFRTSRPVGSLTCPRDLVATTIENNASRIGVRSGEAWKGKHIINPGTRPYLDAFIKVFQYHMPISIDTNTSRDLPALSFDNRAQSRTCTKSSALRAAWTVIGLGKRADILRINGYRRQGGRKNPPKVFSEELTIGRSKKWILRLVEASIMCQAFVCSRWRPKIRIISLGEYMSRTHREPSDFSISIRLMQVTEKVLGLIANFEPLHQVISEMTRCHTEITVRYTRGTSTEIFTPWNLSSPVCNRCNSILYF